MNFLRTRRAREGVISYILLSPALLFLLVFVAIPAIAAIVLSFSRWDLVQPPKFVGLSQWIRVVQDSHTRESIVVTLGIVITSTPVAIAIGLILAVLLDKIPKLKWLFRTAIFAPFVATLTAVSFVWSDLFDLNYGFFNYLLGLIGHAPVAWLSYPETARFAIAIMLIWHNIGFNMLVFIAGLQGIDNTYYEAAIVDGAKPIRIFFHITLPLLSPITFFLLINMIIRGFQIYESVYVLTAGGPGYSTSTLVYFIYRTAFLNFNVGLASAMSMVLFILIGICTIIMWTLQKRWVHYGS